MSLYELYIHCFLRYIDFFKLGLLQGAFAQGYFVFTIISQSSLCHCRWYSSLCRRLARLSSDPAFCVYSISVGCVQLIDSELSEPAVYSCSWLDLLRSQFSLSGILILKRFPNYKSLVIFSWGALSSALLGSRSRIVTCPIRFSTHSLLQISLCAFWQYNLPLDIKLWRPNLRHHPNRSRECTSPVVKINIMICFSCFSPF